MTIGQYFEQQLGAALGKAVEEVLPERMIMNGLAASLKENPAINTGYTLLDFNTSIPSWQEHFEYPVRTSQGVAEFYTHASDDIPLVSSGVEILFGRMKEIALGDVKTTRELERARAMNRDILGESLRDIKRGHDIKLEEIYYNGNSEHRLYGLLNFPNVAVSTLPNDGTGSSTTFASKTPAQNYRDLVTMCLSVSSKSKNAFYADTLLIPQSVYDRISTTILTGVVNSGETILEIVARNMAANPFGIKNILPVPYLDGKGTGGSGLAIAYRKSADNQEAYISDYMRGYNNSTGESNDAVNYKISYQYTSITGGTVVRQTNSMNRFDGI